MPEPSGGDPPAHRGAALEALEADPAADILSVSQNDNPQYCHCPACQAVADEEGSQAGP